ncbi:MAG: universal stress protein [Gemmatimonadota bacterium]
MGFPLLLALADDEASFAAIRMTQVLARARGAVPSVLRALGDAPAAETSMSQLADTAMEEHLRSDYVNECRAAVEKMLSAEAGDVEWAVHVTDKAPIDAIVERVRSQRAELIVMGLRHHGVLWRAITRDLLAEIVRRARVPVLAVRPELFGHLPRRIVVAVDFGAASIRAAHIARELLEDDGTLCLVHVTPSNSPAVRTKLERIHGDLVAAPRMTGTSVVLHGDVQSSIEGCAQAMHADLLAVGSGERSLLDRLAHGPLSIKLAHSAPWSTLIVPARRDD